MNKPGITGSRFQARVDTTETVQAEQKMLNQATRSVMSSSGGSGVSESHITATPSVMKGREDETEKISYLGVNFCHCWLCKGLGLNK